MILEKLTPEVLISAPRRGPAVPNHDGTLALYSLSTHIIGGETEKEIRVMNIETGDSHQIFADPKARDATWLGNTNTVVFLKKGGRGFTFIIAVDADDSAAEPLIVGHIPAPVQALKVKALDDRSVAFAVVGLADTDGSLFNAETDKTAHTGRVYDSYEVRVWTAYKNTQKYTIWYSTLAKKGGIWGIASPLHNVLQGTNFEAPIKVYLPGDTRSEFDLSHRGIIFAAEEPGVTDPSMQGMSNIYFVPLESFNAANVQPPSKIGVQSEDRLPGVCSHPRFGPDGSIIAFIRSPKGRSERRKIYIKHLEPRNAVSVFDMVTGKSWPLAPRGFAFSSNGHFLYMTAEDCGRVGLFKLDLQPNAYPKSLLRDGSVSSCCPLGRGSEEKALVTSSSFVESSLYLVVDNDPEEEPWIISSASNHGADLGLSPKQISEIYFECNGGYCVHAWMMRPRNFDESKKYPLALLVHGGPIGSWSNEWNTKWHAATWAEQGYIVVLPNITGSTGYDLDFAGAVRGDWGGRPYDDLVSCMEHLKGSPNIDIDNAVIAGASYGGYMMNWIQGHPLGRLFKAIVCHSGIFHTPTFMLQTDLFDHDEHFGGPPLFWQNLEGLERWNPSHPELLKNWKTPMLVIYGDKDYSVTSSEGLAAFHALQALGTPSRLLAFADEGHWVLKEENSLEWHRQVFEWVNQYSGIAAEETRT